MVVVVVVVVMIQIVRDIAVVVVVVVVIIVTLASNSKTHRVEAYDQSREATPGHLDQHCCHKILSQGRPGTESCERPAEAFHGQDQQA